MGNRPNNAPVGVSIHAPARGATFDNSNLPETTIAFQSTPLREGRPHHLARQFPQRPVSIHAPARGATVGLPGSSPCCGVSIHAPARGATPRRREIDRSICRFNPRPCARGDTFALLLSTTVGPVSIHAPARGATLYATCALAMSDCFNPRPCARGDPGRWSAAGRG